MDIIETSRWDVTLHEAAACSDEIKATFQFVWELVCTHSDFHAVYGFVSPRCHGLAQHFT